MNMPARVTALVLLAAAFAAPLHAADSAVATDPEALAAEIAARPANKGRVGTMHFVLRNSAGRERRRSAALIHSQLEDATRIAIVFRQPASIRGTAFLSHDHHARQDQNWLFVPATDRVRRLPASDHRDYFMGTDLTYGDIKNDFKFPLDEWHFTAAERIADGERDRYALHGVARLG